MIKVLVSGLKEPVGGLEKVVFEYAKPLIKKYDIHFDFIIFNKNFSKEQELSRLGTIFHVTSRKDNLKKYKEELEDIFRKTSYDAVWGNYTGLTNIDLLVLAKKHNVPVRIAHSHVSALSWGSHVMEYIVKLLHYYNKKRLPKFATHYWGCSESACSFMFPSKVKNNFTVIKNAVDLNIFHPDKHKRNTVREELGIFSSAPIIGHVARMCKEKNQFFYYRFLQK